MRFPVRNVAFLSLRLVGNQLLPLATLPILYGRLGAVAFGQFLLAQAVYAYVSVFVEYGTNISAVRDVAAAAASSASRRPAMTWLQSASVVTRLTRLAMVFLLVVIYTGATQLLEFPPEQVVLTGISLLVGIAVAVQPLWYLQGTEQFGQIAVVQFSAKLLALISTILLVRRSDDLLLAHALFLSAIVLPAVVFGFMVRRDLGVVSKQAPAQALGQVRALLQRNFPVFLSQAATTLFTSTNVLTLGAVLGPAAAGHFGLADKAIRGLAALTTPVTEALFPRVAAALREDLHGTALYLARMLRKLTPALTGSAFCIALGAHLLARLLSGTTPDAGTVTAITIMAPIPALVFVNNILGTQVLLSVGRSYQFLAAVLASGALVLLLSLALLPTFGAVGSPLAALAGEGAIVVFMYVASRSVLGRGWVLRKS